MINRKFILSATPILLFGLLLFGAGAMGTGTELLSTNYYLISIGAVDTPIASLIHKAQSAGYTVLVRSGGEFHSYQGKDPTDKPEEALLASDKLLYVDDGQFLLRVDGTDYDYTVRPGEGKGYTLVVVPHRDLPLAGTLSGIITALQGMGIVGSEVDMNFQAFLQKTEKAPAPPAGVAIDSRLYGLTIAPDWFSAVSAAGLTRVGLRVEVVAEKLPGGTIPEEFRPYVESETGALAKLLLPINRLVDLAKAPGIGYLRPPYRPHPAAP